MNRASVVLSGCGARPPRSHRPGRRFSGWLLLVLAAVPSHAQDAPHWSALVPLLRQRCVMCHSGDHAAAGLHLDSYAGALAGGRNGPVLIPGNTSESELMRRVRGESQPRMPFLSYPLGADEIALLGRWIEAGLPETEAPAQPVGEGSSRSPGAEP